MKKRDQASPPITQPTASDGPKLLRFAVLPFISVPSDVRFGPYLLWKNTPDNWQARFGTDETAFIRMYRDRRGKERGPSASILSRHDSIEPSYPHWLDAVVALSSAAWLTDPFCSDADPWVFEAWSLPPGEHDFVRVSKFSNNLTDAQSDRFYPTPYAHPRSFNVYAARQILDYLSVRLDRSDDDSSGLLIALGHLYRVRRGAPYFGAAFDDIEALWSALEAYAQVPPKAPFVDESRRAELARRYVPMALARRFKYDPWQRFSKNQLVSQFVRKELGRIDVEAATLQDVDNLLEELYKIRSQYTHGGAPERNRLLSKAHGAGIQELLLFLWSIFLKIRLSGDNSLIAADLAESVYDTFHEKRVHDALVESVRGKRRDDWFDKTGATVHELVASAVPVIEEARRIRSIPRRYADTGSLRDAKKAVVLALSAWLQQSEKQAPGEVAALDPLSGLAAEMSQIVTAHGKDGLKIELEIIRLLARRGAHDKNSYGQTASASSVLFLGKKLSIWDLAFLAVRLEELYRGRPILDYE